jgi:phosphopantetheine adenylyltransferase/dephospho-CoA kinase
MTTIGLTGGIASGKSTVARQLESLGAHIIDADRLGHRVYEPGTIGFEKLVNEFGHDVVTSEGEINRQILGGKVFGDPEQMKRLTDIVWPGIRTLAAEEIAEIKQQSPETVVVLEAAVLLEAGWQDLVEEVWVVKTTVKNVVARLKSRNGLNEAQAMSRLESQMTNKERDEYADVKIDNSGTAAQLAKRVETQWKKLRKRIAAPA